MLKATWFLIVSIFFLPIGFGADVNLEVGFSDNSAIFTYDFIFGENESINSFSFEKPRDSKLLGALDGNNPIPVRIAGDFFILNVDDSRNRTFEVVFESKEEYSLTLEKNSFSTYVNFNFDVENFIYTFDSGSFSKEVIEVFPRDHTFLGNGRYQWEVEEVSKDMFFLVDFSKDQILTNETGLGGIDDSNGRYSNFFYSMIALGIIIFFGIFLFLLGHFKATKKEEKKEKESKKDSNEVEKVNEGSSSNDETSDEVNYDVEDSSSKEVEVDLEDKFNDYLEKYLTENEQEVVKVVKEYSGLAQNDILNHLPSLTKSNLSKIITKLHGKHVLNRIRVGKVNKIYLGDKLNFDQVEKEKGE